MVLLNLFAASTKIECLCWTCDVANKPLPVTESYDPAYYFNCTKICCNFHSVACVYFSMPIFPSQRTEMLGNSRQLNTYNIHTDFIWIFAIKKKKKKTPLNLNNSDGIGKYISKTEQHLENTVHRKLKFQCFVYEYAALKVKQKMLCTRILII